MIKNGNLRGKCEQTFVDYFKVQSQHFLVGTKQSHIKIVRTADV